jgi:hypothetical protein
MQKHIHPNYGLEAEIRFTEKSVPEVRERRACRIASKPVNILLYWCRYLEIAKMDGAGGRFPAVILTKDGMFELA